MDRINIDKLFLVDLTNEEKTLVDIIRGSE